jgi:hypothetical protein
MTVNEIKKRLREANQKFEAAGGRGVDLAEEIDRLRDELTKAEKKARKGKTKKLPGFKIHYLREIARNACLHATQPKEETFPSLFETPVPVLARMITTLRDAHDVVYQAFASKIKFEKHGKGPISELRALKAMIDAIKPPHFWGNQRKTTKGKRPSRKL